MEKYRNQTVLRRDENLSQMLRRGRMNIYQFNTGVVRAIDGSPRVSVRSPHDPKWGDCVAIGFMPEDGNTWHFSLLSPARARILAAHLLRIAAEKEKERLGPIDTEVA